jgi:hypothetical protein
MPGIDSTAPISFAAIAKLVAELEARAVTAADIKWLINNPDKLREVAEVARADSFVIASIDPDAWRTMISHMLRGRYDAIDGHTRSRKTFALYEDELDWLCEEPQIRNVLRILSERQLIVLVQRGGLDGAPPSPAKDVAITIGKPAGYVNKLRGEARRLVHARIIELVQQNRAWENCRM